MKLAVRNADGKEVRTLEVDDSVFGIEPNAAVLHQAFVAGRNNQRAGTAQTKTRGEVQGSTRKIRRQKYTGRARQGGIRAPHHVGGGVVFGPVQRSYAQALPKKMKRLAIRSALSGKAADGQLVIIDQLTFETPRTKQMVGILRNVGIERSALVVTAQSDRGVLASLRNLPKTKALAAPYLNVVDMLNHQSLLMTEEAVRIAEQLWAVKAAPKATPTKAAAPKRRAAAKAKAEAVEAAAVAAAPETKEEAPKPRRRAAPKAEAAKVEAAEVTETTEAAAEAPKPRRRAATKAKAVEAEAAEVTEAAPTEEAPKPARAKRKPAASAKKTETEKKPAPRKRATKKKEGEG
jgi:large subunit ribosomal protein L4